MSNSSNLIREIKIDLGADINTLGISDTSISVKIEEALRKISVYAPYIETAMYGFTTAQRSILLPDDTTTVIEVFKPAKDADPSKVIADDTDLFSISRYMYNYNDLMDPYQFMMQKNALSTLQSFIRLADWRYEKSTHTLYVSNEDEAKIYVKSLRKYRSVEEISDVEVYQIVKEYALALCKIIEGNIRRKLQSAPGAISMDGDSLVSEGTSEKLNIESKLPTQFQNLRFGIRV